ncbi:hypothetical protein C900_05197 [Fulvivirga imtechensis AK7]|uniref:Outer membrane protein beta-barrel domain-containing protein n=1 Tax=Fulvivirga imtechensis AK7 TaxID=1237149 RepID=L8JY95_9BACT|nr:hypothetical protein [Fulvivirga imtechensis]ELR73148.1 hypothetical protein C900_05197 [Fulvivirga imtechensis AK7]
MASWYGAAHGVDIEGIDGTWAYGGLMGGPMLSWPISDKVDVDAKLMVGYVVAMLDIDGEDDTGDIGAAFDIGATLRYNFAARWALLVNLDYFNGNSKVFDRKRSISTINPTFGIGFRL